MNLGDFVVVFNAVWDLLTSLKVFNIPILYFMLMSLIGVVVASFLRGKKE